MTDDPLIATRGLPASGKTTFARTLQPSVVRVNRDDLRRMLHGERLFTQWAEAQVTAVQRARSRRCCGPGRTSACDDTNLRGADRAGLGRAGRPARRDFEVHDFTDVPLDECLRRDAARPEADQVGEDAIRRHARAVPGRARTLPLPVPHARPDARPWCTRRRPSHRRSCWSTSTARSR